MFEKTIPEAHHLRVASLHLKSAPVDVDFEDQLSDLVYGFVLDEWLQDSPFVALQVGMKDINLEMNLIEILICVID